MKALVTYIGGPANLRQEVRQEAPPRELHVPVLGDLTAASYIEDDPAIVHVDRARYHTMLLPARMGWHGGAEVFVAWFAGWS